MWRAVRQQRVDAVGLWSDGVHGQLLPESFLFAPVGEPVVDSHFGDQIRAEALSFGGGDASLETLSSAGGETDAQGEKLAWILFGWHFSRKASCFSTCCTPLLKFPAPPCWGSSAVRRPDTGFAGTRAPTWNGCVSFSCWRVRCPPRHQADPDRTGWTLGKKTPDPDCLCLSYCCQNRELPGWTLKKKEEVHSIKRGGGFFYYTLFFILSILLLFYFTWQLQCDPEA